MASSAQKQQQQLPNIYRGGATAAPPPTPSTISSTHLTTSSAAADALSRLLHRLPPTLSLPVRSTRSISATSLLPLISLTDQKPNDNLLSPSSLPGYFQLTDHNISSQLAQSAKSEALTLFELERDQKESCFPKNWPLGYEADEDDDVEESGESFCLDSACSTESTELGLTSLCELTRAIEKVGLKVIQMLASSAQFENPLADDDPTRFCSLMWITLLSFGII